jgi:hypothetical protein
MLEKIDVLQHHGGPVRDHLTPVLGGRIGDRRGD